MTDSFGRRIDTLRLSVTDRCNLRCVYCMPDAHPLPELLRDEEFERIARVMAGLGIRRVRVTGGEPMARPGCLPLIARLRAHMDSVSMTSNGLLLRGRVGEAKRAGLASLNLSLDALDGYAALTGGGSAAEVLETMEEALAAGLPVKLNVVPIRGVNEGELEQIAALARERPICVRFIELMPIGCARRLAPIPDEELRRRMEDAFGPLRPDRERHGFGPAEYVKPDGFAGSLGWIRPLSHSFCDRCNRLRVTADGWLKLCLNHSAGTDLRTLLRSGADDDALAEAIRDAVRHKPARHMFGEQVSDPERRGMSAIGG